MTDLTTLTDDEVRVVRDDRSAIGDAVYKILELPIDAIALRTTIFAYLSGISTEAMAESLTRLTPQTEEGARA